MINVAINGYGRIGRNVLRALYERPELNGKMQVVAINDLGSAEMNAHLTQFDTTHGRFNQSVSVDQDQLIIGSDCVRMLSERDPRQLPWDSFQWISYSNAPASLLTVKRHDAIFPPVQNVFWYRGQHMDATVVYGINRTQPRLT